MIGIAFGAPAGDVGQDVGEFSATTIIPMVVAAGLAIVALILSIVLLRPLGVGRAVGVAAIGWTIVLVVVGVIGGVISAIAFLEFASSVAMDYPESVEAVLWVHAVPAAGWNLLIGLIVGALSWWLFAYVLRPRR